MELSPALRFLGGASDTPYPEKSGQQPAIKIGIVGCGSRGLTVLERLCALAGDGERQVEISVFDPQRPGPGLHSVDQPSYLMLNTVASQISMFPDSAALGGLPGRRGPNFYEWCLRFKSFERDVRPNEFLPRAWLGEYLAWTYDEVVRTLPEEVKVIHHAKVVDNIELTDLGGFELSTTDKKHEVDWLLITVGHAEAPVVEKPSREITRRLSAYPQPSALYTVSSTDTVGIEGLGLSAMDVVAGLTVGRGGRFVEGPEGLRYEASGEEPTLFMYSRSGLPYCTRPDIAPHHTVASPLIFTLSAVAHLRSENPEGLDFDADVLPLLNAEMFAEYFGTVAARHGESALRIKSEIASAFLSGEIASKCQALADRFDVPLFDNSAFSLHRLRSPVNNYSDWVKAFIKDDLKESTKGLDHSPFKAAVEVWRSCREQLRRVVDNEGLTPDSHRLFFDQYAPLVNRLVAGPQKERHQELLALADAGVLHWSHSSTVVQDPDTDAVSIRVDENQTVALTATVPAYVSDDRNGGVQPKLIRQLSTAGIIHNLSVDGRGVYVDSHGKAQPNLWITGSIVEGVTYYNHYVPSSGSYSRAFVDADRIAREMLGILVAG